MAKGIRIQDRDREILKEIINFNGLPASVIIDLVKLKRTIRSWTG